MRPGNILNNVFVPHQAVGTFNQWSKTHIDFTLSPRCYFVMVTFHGDTNLLHEQHHFRANILKRIVGSYREITFFMSWFVTQVWVFIPAGVPFCFNRIDRIKRFIRVGIVLNIVKNEKFRFRSKVGSVSNSSRFKISFRFLSDIARIAAVFFPGDRVDDITNHANRCVFHKRVHDRGGRIGNDQHVAVIDSLPSPDAGAIEPQSFFKQMFFQLTHRHRKMLPGSK